MICGFVRISTQMTRYAVRFSLRESEKIHIIDVVLVPLVPFMHGLRLSFGILLCNNYSRKQSCVTSDARINTNKTCWDWKEQMEVSENFTVSILQCLESDYPQGC